MCGSDGAPRSMHAYQTKSLMLQLYNDIFAAAGDVGVVPRR